jgi:hypothetical protein
MLTDRYAIAQGQNAILKDQDPDDRETPDQE